MLINLSNHPSEAWSLQQLTSSRALYNNVYDFPFPMVDPECDEAEICLLTEQLVQHCLEMLPPNQSNAVHVMGEMTLTFSVVSALLEKGIACVASTTARVASTNDNKKTSEFQFVRFRAYSACDLKISKTNQVL
jgi:hypothetical protein